ncbi:MAG: hypothetical protein U9Q62_07390 [Campylobacterota bacterium]|nr:hypothetical protein [Campylobacterota bacterium]
MVFNFKSKAHIVFIDTQSPLIEEEEMLDIILSPAYYWVKRVTLPVKYVREVKKLLPSLFEDILPSGKYSYTAYRDGDDFMIFAYDDRAILDALSEKGVKGTQIRYVYFAQSEFSDLEGALELEGDDVMIQKGGVIVKLPLFLAGETAIKLDVSDHECSSHKIELARFTHIADKKSLTMFISFMAVLIVLVAIEWAITGNKTVQIEEKRTELLSTYHLKATMLQNEAVLKRLEQRYVKQMKIRQVNSALLGVKLLKDENMVRLNLLPSGVVAEYAIAKEIRANKIIAQLKRTKLEIKESYKEGLLRVEVAL